MFIRATRPEGGEIIVNLATVKAIQLETNGASLLFLDEDVAVRVDKESADRIEKTLFPPPGKMMVA